MTMTQMLATPRTPLYNNARRTLSLKCSYSGWHCSESWCARTCVGYNGWQ